MKYTRSYKDQPEGYIFIKKSGACTITLTGAAAMPQDELDKFGNLFANAEKYKEFLNDIQKDLSDYQNEKGIGSMDDKQWQELFVERVIATITSYESIDEVAPIWKEIRDDYEDEGIRHIDAWTSEDEFDEDGHTIAKINMNDGEVEYLDERAKTDQNAQEIIQYWIEQGQVENEKTQKRISNF